MGTHIRNDRDHKPMKTIRGRDFKWISFMLLCINIYIYIYIYIYIKLLKNKVE